MIRPAYSICICPDSRLLRGRLETLLAAHPPEEQGAWRMHVFWGDEGLGASFWEHLTLQGLFASPKALIIRNAQILTADNLNTLSAKLLPLAGSPAQPLPAPLIWPLLCFEVDIEKSKPKIAAHIANLPCFVEAEKRGWVDLTHTLSPASLSAFIRAESERHGLRLRPEELHTLERSLPADAAFVESELMKLALLADPEGRLPHKNLTLGTHTQEITIFELMRILQQRGDPTVAWRQILADKLSGENMIFSFIAILLREARTLWQTLAGPAPYLPPQAALQKKIVADSLGYAGIARLWELALAADKGIKTGERTPDQAFEKLSAGLFLLFSGKQSR